MDVRSHAYRKDRIDMRSLLLATVMSAALLTAVPYAQTTGQTPAAPTPATPAPAAPAPAAAPAAAPRPIPDAPRMGFINLQRIASESSEGKASTAKVQALTQKKAAEIGERNKALQAAQQKLQQGGSVLSDSAREQLEREIERLQRDVQRMQQDAQAEVQELQQDLQNEFQRKLLPVIQKVAAENRLHILFSQADSGIIWADSGLDLTAEVVKRFDTSPAPAAAAPTSSAPAPAPTPAAPKPPE
jgi:outer membrane protein